MIVAVCGVGWFSFYVWCTVISYSVFSAVLLFSRAGWCAVFVLVEFCGFVGVVDTPVIGGGPFGVFVNLERRALV